jgi:hypothetical protein
MKKICLALIAFSFLLLSCGEPVEVLDGTYSVYGTTDIKAGISFPPFSNSDQIDFTIREIKNLAIDRIRIAID